MKPGESPHVDFLAAALRGEAPAWPADADVQEMLSLGEHHGVNPLLNAASRKRPPGWPSAYTQGLAAEARHHTGHEILRRRELVRVIDALTVGKVQPLIMKGAALAYTHYESPALRPRCDIDLLVKEDDLDGSHDLLQELGYTRWLSFPGRLISHECGYVRVEAGLQHVIDLHWRINNRQVFAKTFGYDELFADAVTTPAISRNAHTLNVVHALLLACMHRVANLEAEKAGDRLIWLYDIHLLLKQLDDSQWERACALARETRIAAVVLDGVKTASQRLGAPRHALGAQLAPAETELSARLLSTNRRERISTDFVALSWSDRLALIREAVLPPTAYLRHRYGDKRPTLQHLKTLLAAPWRNLQSKP